VGGGRDGHGPRRRRAVDLTLEELRHGDDGKLILRASAKVDRYAHRITAGKGLAARWLTIEVTAIARRDSIAQMAADWALTDLAGGHLNH
jgi:hypothetical protein